MYIATLEAVSNKETWTVPIEVIDVDTNDPIDITNATITLAVRNKKTLTQNLTATVGSGITITSGTGGIFQWSFTPSQMGALCPGTYDVGVTILLNGTTTQLIIGTVPVLDGIVS